MKIDWQYGMKWLALGVSYSIVLQLVVPPVEAQDLPTELNLVVVQGDGATNNIGQRVAVWPVVRIEDQKHAPISGCVVVFTLPTDGATGEFNGSKTLTITTDNQGQAAAQGLKVNYTAGKVPIHITASYRGLTARTIITQFTVAPPGSKAGAGGGGGGHGKLIGILAVIGGAAAAGGVLATRKSTSGSSGPSTPAVTPIGITPGTGAISPPR